MKKTLFFILTFFVVSALGLAYWMHSSSGGDTAVSEDTSLPTLSPSPLGSPTLARPGTQGKETQPTMTIKNRAGESITTKDFIHNGTTFEDSMNKGVYILAGNLDYCADDPTPCQAGPKVPYRIFYYSSNQAFGILLAEEPLGETRKKMEKNIMTILGLNEADMCRLVYVVDTPLFVSERYGSVPNLGFSFCPGATVLPE